MGTGSSHNQVVIETSPDPVTGDFDSTDVVITREVRRPVRQATIEKIVTETGAEVGKVRQDTNGLLDATSLHNDEELKDIQDLEHTFDSLGIPLSNNHNSDEVNHKIPNEHLHKRDVAPLKTKWSDVKVGVPTSQNSSERNKCRGTAVSGMTDGGGVITNRSSSGPQARLDIPTTALLDKNNDNNNNTKSAPTKFTWNLAEPTKSAEEWIYQRNTVDGFDPDKFRKANKKDVPHEIKSSSSLMDDMVMLHPHSVPEYDVSEQQILDSIEKEFVS